MNILFILKSYEMGGVEVVTSVLANKFVSEGHHVCIFAFAPAEKSSIKKRLDERIHTYTLNSQKYNKENVHAMRAVMIEEKTNIVINQWGLPFYPLKTALKAAKDMDMKFISVYHNTPDMNGRLRSVNNDLAIEHKPIRRIILYLKRYIFKEITAYGMRWNYQHSDRFLVLSSSFIDKFKSFTGIRRAEKLMVQTNPLTIESPSSDVDIIHKRKEIIYVGRIDDLQKRVDRIIEVWSFLENKFPDWHLTIVGDGPEKKTLQEMTKNLNLRRVNFEGFQNPLKYYKRASFIVLTSEFEGFPLVLAEAMNFGVVPVVYNSYAAANDIVADDINGILIPFNNSGFNAADMAGRMADVMKCNKTKHLMAYKAIETSREYNVDLIYQQWMKLLNNL